MPKTPARKNLAWAGVAAGVGLVMVGGTKFAYRMGPLPRGLFLVLGIANLIFALINLRRAYHA